MVEYALSELFRQDSVDKQIDISFDDVHITNSDFRGQDFELTESLCSESELRFGCCEASVLKFKISNRFGELKDKWLTVRTVLEGNIDLPFQFGKYKVNQDEVSGDKQYRNITAYDAMYDIINAEVAEWYNSLNFPISQKEFRNSFFAYLGIPHINVVLIHDDMLIERTLNTTTLSGKDVITSLCELNGVFGHINRSGEFAYISLPDNISIYPSIHLFPGNELFPVNDTLFDRKTLSNGRYISCEYEDFETTVISKLQVRQEKNDVGAIADILDGGTNTYIIENNFLVYGKSPEELSAIAHATLQKISHVKYRPTSISLRGNPCIEVGDGVICSTKRKDVVTYVLQRTIKGVQGLRDSFISEGAQEYSENVNSVQRAVNQLRGKTNVLERTVEMLSSEINDVETGLKSQIKQTSDKVEAKVSRGDVSSQLSIELGKVVLKGNRLVIESDNFKLNEDGTVSISGALLSNSKIVQETDTTELHIDMASIYGGYKGEGRNEIDFSWRVGGKSCLCLSSENYVGIIGGLAVEDTDGRMRAGYTGEVMIDGFRLFFTRGLLTSYINTNVGI